MATDARAEILGRIRTALSHTEAVQETRATGYAAIERSYDATATLSHEAIVDLLEDRLRDYDAGVYHSSAVEVAEVAGRILAERGKQRMAVPSGIPAAWLPQNVQWMEDRRTGHAGIDSCDGVLTSATVAIATTGTIILQDAPGQGRRAVSLLPDYHLCLLETRRIVQTVPEAIALLQPTAALATTFFSGPSATADIEMTRIKGVHGPRFVDVILIR